MYINNYIEDVTRHDERHYEAAGVHRGQHGGDVVPAREPRLYQLIAMIYI